MKRTQSYQVRPKAKYLIASLLAALMATSQSAAVHAQVADDTLDQEYVTSVLNDWYLENLLSTEMKRELAEDLAKRLTAGDAEAERTLKVVMEALSYMLLVGTDYGKATPVIDEIVTRRLTDFSPGSEADQLAGRVVIQTLFKSANKLKQDANTGLVARALISAMGQVQWVGTDAEHLEEEIFETILVQGLSGNAASKYVESMLRPIIDAAIAEQNEAIGHPVGELNQPGKITAGKGLPAAATRPAGMQKPKLAGVEKPLQTSPKGAVTRVNTPAVGGAMRGSQQSPEQRAGGSQPAAQPAPSNSRISGGDGGGSDAMRTSIGSRGDQPSGPPAGTDNVGRGAGSGGTHGDGGAGRDGGLGTGGGSGSGTGSGHGTGGGTGGGSGGPGSQSGAGNGSGGSGSGDGEGGKKDGGEGGGESGGGTGDHESHERTDYILDLSGSEEEGFSMEYVEGTPRAPGMERDRGTGTELSNATGGRLGGTEAKNATRGINVITSGGGARGPGMRDSRYSGVQLSAEEKANTQRALQMAESGGVVTPADGAGSDGMAVTDRDIKEIGLKGTGGAKGPTDNVAPGAPQPVQSPLAGPGVVAPKAPAVPAPKKVGVSGVQQAAEQIQQKVGD